MFDKLAPGAHSTVTGLVTLLAVAKNMAYIRDNIIKGSDPQKNILFVIFNGVSNNIVLRFTLTVKFV